LDKYEYHELFSVWVISFIIGILLLIFSALFCLKAIQVKYIAYGPKPNDLVQFINKKEVELHTELIKAYHNIIIRKNYNTNVAKGYWVKNAIVTLTYAIFIVLFATIIIIFIAMNMKMLWALTILGFIFLLLMITFQYINTNENKFIREFIKQL
jgi:uncharacterized integral membrane protein